MDKKKIFILIICFFAFCQSMLCQPTYERKFVEQDSTFEIFKENNISFSCFYSSSSFIEWFRFIIKKDKNTAEVIISSEGDHYELSGYELNTLLLETLLFGDETLNKEEIIKFPDKHYLFYENVMTHCFSDLEKVDNQVYYFYNDIDFVGEEGPYKKYTYKVQQYSSESKQLTNVGREICLFSNTFDFELGEGSPVSKWLEFKEPVIKNLESLSEYPFGKLENNVRDFALENELMNGFMKWTQTESALRFIFYPSKKQSFYFNVNIESKPYIEEIIVQDSEAENVIAHYFSANGNITKIITSDNAEVVSFLYDDAGFLTAKITQKADNPTEAIKVSFDIEKEYKTKVMDEDVEY